MDNIEHHLWSVLFGYPDAVATVSWQVSCRPNCTKSFTSLYTFASSSWILIWLVLCISAWAVVHHQILKGRFESRHTSSDIAYAGNCRNLSVFDTILGQNLLHVCWKSFGSTILLIGYWLIHVDFLCNWVQSGSYNLLWLMCKLMCNCKFAVTMVLIIGSEVFFCSRGQGSVLHCCAPVLEDMLGLLYVH